MRGYSSRRFTRNRRRNSFKSYPLAGVFNPVRLSRTEYKLFQVIPPCGGILAANSLNCGVQMFQVIPPCGGIPHCRQKHHATKLGFKSYPLAGVFLILKCKSMLRPQFQVIPPCGGILGSNGNWYIGSEVSSHTPLRGYSAYSDSLRFVISSFKSYPLAGVFLYKRIAKSSKIITVSSHTPLRGYSMQIKTSKMVRLQFQVIPPCGGIQAGR